MTPTIAGVEGLVVAAGCLLAGYLVVSRVLGPHVHRLTAWSLALPGVVGISTVLMVAHMLTGGAVFRSAILTRIATACVVGTVFLWGGLKRRARSPASLSVAEVAKLFVVVCVGVAIWGSPAFRAVPLPSPWQIDIMRHVGWTTQMLQGQPTFSAPVAATMPNDYPWLFHATLALLTRFTPGGHALLALAPLQLLCVAGGILALFGLGRELTGRSTTGVFSAVFGALSGGFGFLLLDRVDAIVYPRRGLLAYMGDLLLVRSYNGAMSYVTGPYPRDLAFALFPSFLLLLVIALRRRSWACFVACGSVVGMLGLCGAESFFVASLVAFAAIMLGSDEQGIARKSRRLISVFVPAAAVYALWAVPLLSAYLSYESRSLAIGLVAMPPRAILVAWGIVTPFAVAGVLWQRPRRRDDPAALVVPSLCVAAGLLIVAASFVARVGGVFETLGFAHRYWPLLYAGAALYAALAASSLLDRGLRQGGPLRLVSLAASALVVAVAITSPIVASLAATAKLSEPTFASALSGHRHNLLSVLAPDPGKACVIVAPRVTAERVFAYTGSRFVHSFAGRGRFKTIGRQELRARRFASMLLLEAQVTGRRWRRVARRYGVDVVVIPVRRANLPGIHGLYRTRARLGEQSFVVVQVGSCGRPPQTVLSPAVYASEP